MRPGGGQNIDDIASFYLHQYSILTRLNKLGFTSSIDNLDCITAEAFNIISIEIDKIQEENSKRKSKR